MRCPSNRKRFPVRRKRPNRPSVDNARRASWRPLNGGRFTDGRLPYRGAAPCAPLRRHAQPGRHALRDLGPATPLERGACSLCALGLQPRRHRRCAHGRHPVPDQAAGRGRQRQWPAPTARSRGQRLVGTAAHGPGAAAARVARRVRRHGPAAGLPACGRAHAHHPAHHHAHHPPITPPQADPA